MRTILLLTFLSFSLFTMAQIDYQSNDNRGGGDRVTGNGEVTTQDRQSDPFSGVSACCNFRVEIDRSATQAIRVEAESNLLEYVITEVKNGRLDVRFREDADIRTKKSITVYVSIPELDYLSANSAASVTVVSMFEGKALELDVDSGASIRAKFTGDMVTATADSGGRLDLSGSGREIRARANSGGTIEAHDYTARIGDARVSSGAGVEISVSDRLKADASSGGRVRYRGGAADIVTDASSGGSVRGN